MWAQVQVSPDSRPAFAVALLQIDVLRFDGYLSDHVDDGMRPGGRAKKKAKENDDIVSRRRRRILHLQMSDFLT